MHDNFEHNKRATSNLAKHANNFQAKTGERRAISHPRKKAGLTYQLNSDHQNSLKREFPITQVEQVLEARAEKFHDQGVVFAARPEVVHLRYALCGHKAGKNPNGAGEK